MNKGKCNANLNSDQLKVFASMSDDWAAPLPTRNCRPIVVTIVINASINGKVRTCLAFAKSILFLHSSKNITLNVAEKADHPVNGSSKVWPSLEVLIVVASTGFSKLPSASTTSSQFLEVMVVVKLIPPRLNCHPCSQLLQSTYQLAL